MERTKTIKPHKGDVSAILCSDFHLREDIPECRTDDFQKALWNKVKFISELQLKYQCKVLHAGDLFHHWKPSPNLLSLAAMYLPREFYTIYGQHDLPQHNYELRSKSGIYTLFVSGIIEVLKKGVHWGKEVKEPTLMHNGRVILIWHHLTYQATKPFPGATDGMAAGILKKYPDYDLILTGDNHIPFVEEFAGRLLVNPGSLTRQSANQIDHRPRVYLYYAESNTVEPIYLSINKDDVTRSHIINVEERDARIEAFISQLNNDWEIAVSFDENMKLFEQANKIQQPIMDIIYKAIEND